MFALLQKISKNLVVVIPVMMVAGFVYGVSADTGWLKSMIVPFTFLMVYPMMVTLKIRKVFEGATSRRKYLLSSLISG